MSSNIHTRPLSISHGKTIQIVLKLGHSSFLTIPYGRPFKRTLEKRRTKNSPDGTVA